MPRPRGGIAEINTNPTQPARSLAPAAPDTCPSPGQREARPGWRETPVVRPRHRAGGGGDGVREPTAGNLTGGQSRRSAVGGYGGKEDRHDSAGGGRAGEDGLCRASAG